MKSKKKKIGLIKSFFFKIIFFESLKALRFIQSAYRLQVNSAKFRIQNLEQRFG